MASKLEPIDLHARDELIRWAGERLDSHREKLENLKCEERAALVLRGRIDELKTLVKQLEGDSTAL